MSSTLLNRTFGLRDYGYVKTIYKDSKVYFHIEDRRPRCSVYGSTEAVRDGAYERTFRLPPIGLHLVYAVLSVPRLRCRSCGAKRQAEVRFAAPMKRKSGGGWPDFLQKTTKGWRIYLKRIGPAAGNEIPPQGRRAQEAFHSVWTAFGA
jgi:hypothetical protein